MVCRSSGAGDGSRYGVWTVRIHGRLPDMVHEGLLTVHDGTFAASANYAGYLAGALLAARLCSHESFLWVLASVGASVLCLLALPSLQSPGLSSRFAGSLACSAPYP
nr:YbfB/YjiJ family MFS transporter [Pseudomonas veronii]